MCCIDEKDNKGGGFSTLNFVFGIILVFVFVFGMLMKLQKSKVITEEKEFPLGLNERQEIIFEMLEMKKELTVGDIMKRLKNVSERTLRRDMSVLEKLGYSRKEGTTKGSKYIFVG